MRAPMSSLTCRVATVGWLPWLGVLWLLAGCGLATGTGASRAGPRGGGPTVPGLYVAGDPCGDGVHRDVTVALLPDNLYQLTVTQRDDACEPGLAVAYLGLWVISPDARVITLIGAPAHLARIAVVDHLTLRFEARGPVEEEERLPDFRIAARGRLVPLQDRWWARGLRGRGTIVKRTWR